MQEESSRQCSPVGRAGLKTPLIFRSRQKDVETVGAVDQVGAKSRPNELGLCAGDGLKIQLAASKVRDTNHPAYRVAQYRNTRSARLPCNAPG